MKQLLKKFNRYMLDHPVLKVIVDYTVSIFLTAISAFLFAYGFRSFVAPSRDVPHLVSGGASGIAQILVQVSALIAESTGKAIDEKLFQSIFFFAVNIPLFFLAWFKIGKRFAILTFVNVLLVSVFNEIIPEAWTEIFAIDTNEIARALFAGLLTGLSSALAYAISSSAGGIDIIALYIAEKKSTSIGKYSMFINASVVIIYVLIHQFRIGADRTTTITMGLFTIIYFFTGSKVVDILNVKNKKTELQITTSSEQMAPILIHTFPHSCTIVNAKGGYTGDDRKIIYMVTSYSEVKRAIKIMRQVDPNCFVIALNSYQVYGNFYIRPIK